MPRYLANFDFQHPEGSLRPEDKMWGSGVVQITTDKVPVTAEEFKEIAKEIFRLGKGAYDTVAVVSLEPLDTFIDDSHTVLEGTIVNE